MQKYSGERIKGKINAYSEAVQSGVVVCEVGNIYLFTRKEWLSELEPLADLAVSFTAERNWAKAIAPVAL